MHTWKISQRLMAGFGLVIVALLGMSIYSMLIARGIDGALTANATQNAVIQRAAINFRGSAHDRSIAVRDVVLAPSEDARKKEVESIARLADFYAKSATQLDAVLQTATQVPPGSRAHGASAQRHRSTRRGHHRQGGGTGAVR